MDGAMVTMVGRVASNVTVTNNGKGDRVAFRVVSTERRFDDATGSWVDGDEFGANVVCWRQLAAGALAGVRKGDPVVVKGRISTRRLEKDDGSTTYWTEVKADVVALDLARAGTRFRRLPPEERSSADEQTTPNGSDTPASDALSSADEREPSREPAQLAGPDPRLENAGVAAPF